MIAEIKGTQIKGALTGSKGALAGKILPSNSRSTLLNNRVKRSTQAARAVIEINKSTSTNGSGAAGSVKPEAVEEEVKQHLRYRLATAEADQDALYKSTAWSVHNRLVDSFEKTHAHWE
jgi:hypothetical protein